MELGAQHGVRGIEVNLEYLLHFVGEFGELHKLEGGVGAEEAETGVFV